MDLMLSTPCFVYVFAINICCCITVQITQLSLSISLHECTLHLELLSLQADITIAWLSSHQSKTNEWPVKTNKAGQTCVAASELRHFVKNGLLA